MNKLSTEDRVRILQLLYEGHSIRSVARLSGTSKNTVSKLLMDAGRACSIHHNEHVRNLRSQQVYVDAIWSFTCTKAKRVPATNPGSEGAYDTWTWIALDADSKLIVSHDVGGRDAECAYEFIQDVASRLSNRVRLTNGDHGPCLRAVEDTFSDDDVDFATLIKIYGTPSEDHRRYSQDVYKGGRVGRQKLTMRTHTLRFLRGTNDFSKKIENHAHAVALHLTYYNFVRIHSKFRVSPAMAAGVTDGLWQVADIAKLVEANERPATRSLSAEGK